MPSHTPAHCFITFQVNCFQLFSFILIIFRQSCHSSLFHLAKLKVHIKYMHFSKEMLHFSLKYCFAFNG